MIGGIRNKLRSTLLTLILTPLKTNPQYVYEFGCTLLNPTQILLNYFLTQNNSLKTKSQISNLLSENRTQPGKRGQQSPKATGAAKQNSGADGEEKNTTETGMWIEEQMQHKNP
jgi:hypothetical protein